MRTNKSPLEFMRTVAKKKPRYQELLDNVFKMSEAEINALQEPLWVREALRSCRKEDDTKMYVDARLAQVIAAEERAAEQPKPTYEVRVWDTGSGYVGTDAYGEIPGWKIEMNSGDSFAIIDDTMVRVGDSMVRVGEYDRTPLMHQSKFVGYMTLENYKGFHRALLNQKHKHL